MADAVASITASSRGRTVLMVGGVVLASALGGIAYHAMTCQACRRSRAERSVAPVSEEQPEVGHV